MRSPTMKIQYASLSAFLQEISLITDSDKFDEDKPAITLMTVHGSKGLESPIVFVAGLEENLFPVMEEMVLRLILKKSGDCFT